MPASPKDTSTPLPRVSIRRGSAHIAKRFFRGRRGLRRTLFLLALVAIYYFLIRPDDNPYDMQFIDDNDEDIVQHPSSAYRDRISAMKAVQKERQRKARTRPPMTRSRDGLIRVGNWDGRHPLFEIIDTSEREWKAELDYRPSTLSEASESYTDLYGVSPPSSFSHFFNLLPPQCPFPSFSSIHLYKSVPSSHLRLHQSGLEGSPMTITFVIRSGRAGGGAAEDYDDLFHVRETSRSLMSLLMEISETLPDLRFTLSADYPRNSLPYYLRTDLVDHQRLGEKFAEADDGDDGQDGNGVYTFHGWRNACAPGDPLNHGVEIAENPGNTSKFIYSPKPLSLCQHRSLASLSGYFAGPSPNFGVVHPVFALTTTPLHGDILLPRPEIAQAVPSKIPWGEKRSNLYWRGLASLGPTSDELVVPINRLMTFYNTTGAELPPHSVLVPKNGDGFTIQINKPVQMMKTRIDLAFTRCRDQIGCGSMPERYPFIEGAEMRWSHSKFVLDLESNDATSFRQLLLSGSLVLRASLFEDFWVAQARPWVHYVPIQLDFSDLASILLFFEAHDHLAKRIALNGQNLARECFGRAGTKAGLMGVLGEYGRMWSDDRRGADGNTQ